MIAAFLFQNPVLSLIRDCIQLYRSDTV